jgi:hypothetical protein
MIEEWGIQPIEMYQTCVTYAIVILSCCSGGN